MQRKGSGCKGLVHRWARLPRAMRGSSRQSLSVLSQSQEPRDQGSGPRDFLCDLKLFTEVLSSVFSSEMRIRSPGSICS